MRSTFLVFVLGVQASALLPAGGHRSTAPPGWPSGVRSRRAFLGACGAFALAPQRSARAEQVLSMDDDLSAPAPEEVAKPISISVVDSGTKTKVQGPAARIKELSAKGGLTDKEKKELRRLKQEEMCEMLGKGC